jgi:hypothetical protein
MSNLSQFTVLIVHLVEKTLLFNREVKYQIRSGSGLAGSGSEMIYSGSWSGSGSGKRFRIRPDPDQYQYLQFGIESSIKKFFFSLALCMSVPLTLALV